MTEYRKARAQFIKTVAVAILAITGVQSAIVLIPGIPNNLAGGLSLDLIRICLISLVLYGSYHLQLEWISLKPEDRTKHWQADYYRLQKVAVVGILAAFSIEVLRDILNSGSLEAGWVVKAWGAGFITGLFIWSHKIKILHPLRIPAGIIIAGNVVLAITTALATNQYSHIASVLLVMLWSFSIFWYYPLVFFGEKTGLANPPSLDS